MTKNISGIIGAAVFTLYAVLIGAALLNDTHWGWVVFITLMGVIAARNMATIAWNSGAINTYDKIEARRTHAI